MAVMTARRMRVPAVLSLSANTSQAPAKTSSNERAENGSMLYRRS